jgi:cyclic pyranopterin phosphate synthase
MTRDPGTPFSPGDSPLADARPAPIRDGLGRPITYLRVSVTDRCNLRCLYCVSHPTPFIPHPDILRYEEILALIGLTRNLGVTKVRFTGGEPFARKGFPGFLEAARACFPDLDLRLTTNATLLTPHVPLLVRAGIRRVNISLDTLDAATFARITGEDLFSAVRGAIDACLSAGLKVKMNVVAMKGVNDHELPALVDFARTHPLDLRFIEYMPIGEGSRWTPWKVWPAGDILEEARELADLTPVAPRAGDRGPARVYAIEGGLGRLGFITPLSCHFCAECNRLRLTAGGTLRTCLFSDRVYRLRTLLREDRLGLAAVERVVKRAVLSKPLGFRLLEERAKDRPVCQTEMSAIGG